MAARLSKVEHAHESVTRRLVATETERDRLRRAAKRLRQLAEIDRLTGLLNGETFMKRCNAALNQPDAEGMFVFVDLNDFKPINDRFGHDAGDHVLRTIATRLRDETRRRDLVARLGGDEFGLWLDGGDKSNLRHIVNNLEQVLTQPITWSPNGSRQILLNVGASFGAAFAPEHGRRAEQLKRFADLEMYRHKEASRRIMRA
ncbi:MAG: GGDEF domain-containing protein [Pelagimonas sp.]|nr:GGDEF domain-containing protein [Pelagimonas sp.]